MPRSAAFPAVKRAAEDHFAALADRRFFSPQALDDPGVATLQQLVTARTRMAPAARRRIGSALTNTGAWLRHFHAIKGVEAGAPVRASADEVKDALRQCAAIVADNEGDESVERAGERACAAIDAGALRDPIAMGLAHGAFHPGHVLVSPDGAVAGVGMEAPAHAPIYEDLAHFFMSLRVRRARGRSSGTRRFFSGYFEDVPVPQRALAAFALLATLDEWAQAGSEGIRGAAAARTLRDEVNALCSLLER